MTRELVFRATTPWTVPLEGQGQMLEVAYALDQDAEVCLVRTTDRASGGRPPETVAYAYAAGDDDWQPQNGPPRLGRRIGRCVVD